MPIGIGSVTAIELLAARAGGGPACFRATFLNEDRDVLSRLVVAEQLKKGYQFLRLQPEDPIVLDGSQRLYLLIEPLEGGAPTFFITKPGRGELTQTPASPEGAGATPNGAASLIEGSLVYRPLATTTVSLNSVHPITGCRASRRRPARS